MVKGLDQSMKDISKFPVVTNVHFRDQTFFDALNRNDQGVDGNNLLNISSN